MMEDCCYHSIDTENDGSAYLSQTSNSINSVSNRLRLQRSQTTPATRDIEEEIVTSTCNEAAQSEFEADRKEWNKITIGFLFFAIYLTLGVAIYTLFRTHFHSQETQSIVDGLYFSIVTMCTVGYGDITPRSSTAKIYSIAFVVVGFGFIDILLSGMLSYILDLQESLFLRTVEANNDVASYLIDMGKGRKGRMTIRIKVGIAIGALLFCVGLGASVLHFVEKLGWIDSLYVSIMSVTTVGYGDYAFSTVIGRIFASIWLVFSTLTVARAFLYLSEARIDARHRKFVEYVLRKNMTVSDFRAADIDHDNSVRFANNLRTKFLDTIIIYQLLKKNYYLPID